MNNQKPDFTHLFQHLIKHYPQAQLRFDVIDQATGKKIGYFYAQSAHVIEYTELPDRTN